MKKFLVLLGALTLSLFGLIAPAQAAATDTVKIWVGLGSGHMYNGSYDACTGSFTATGTTNGATGTYAETVTGTYNKATGALSFTSVYGLDAHGVIDDSSGVNNSAYSYTVTGTVADNWVTGSYTVTKTPEGGSPQTSAPESFGGQSMWFEVSDNGGTCTPPPVLDGGNHGECVSAKAKSGVKGKELAEWAKQVNRVGADCHLAAS